jgi:hypothetical protein
MFRQRSRRCGGFLNRLGNCCWLNIGLAPDERSEDGNIGLRRSGSALPVVATWIIPSRSPFEMADSEWRVWRPAICGPKRITFMHEGIASLV